MSNFHLLLLLFLLCTLTELGHNSLAEDASSATKQPSKPTDANSANKIKPPESPDTSNSRALGIGMIGIHFKREPGRASVRVVRVIPTGPAFKAGIVPGDHIETVNGVRIDAEANDEYIHTILRGPIGSTVAITYDHEGKKFDVILNRMSSLLLQKANTIESDAFAAKVADKVRLFQKPAVGLWNPSVVKLIVTINIKDGSIADLKAAPDSTNTSVIAQKAAFAAVRAATPLPVPNFFVGEHFDVKLALSYGISYRAPLPLVKKTQNVSGDANSNQNLANPEPPNIDTEKSKNGTKTTIANSKDALKAEYEHRNEVYTLFWKGLTAINSKHWVEAISCFEKVQSLDNNFFASKVYLGKAYLETNDKAKALGILAPLSAWASDSLFADKRDASGFIDPYKDSSNKIAAKQLPELLIRVGDKESLKNQTIINKVSLQTLIAATMDLESQDRQEEASILRKAANQKNNANEVELEQAAYFLFSKHYYKEALELYKRARAVALPSTRVLIGIMSCQSELGQLEELLDTKKEFVDKFPTDSQSPKFKQEILTYNPEFAKIRQSEKNSTVDKPIFTSLDMPIKVFVPALAIESVSWAEKPVGNIDYEKCVDKATEQWADASDGLIKFQKVDNVGDCDVSVQWVNKAGQMEHDFWAGQAGFATNYNGKRRRNISLLVPTKDNSENARQFLETTMHEFGHILGLSHSSDPKDIMYWSVVLNPEPRNLSENDRRRLKKMYLSW